MLLLCASAVVRCKSVVEFGVVYLGVVGDRGVQVMTTWKSGERHSQSCATTEPHLS